MYIFVFFWGLVSGWLREWILSDLGFILGVILGAQINKKHGKISAKCVFFFTRSRGGPGSGEAMPGGGGTIARGWAGDLVF